MSAVLIDEVGPPLPAPVGPDPVADAVAPKPPRPRGGEHRATPRTGSADWWITPRWAVEALLERESFPGPVWEAACGDGAMSRVLEAAGYPVISTDLVDRGYGQGGCDFLLCDSTRGAQSIVTNPPFSIADRFMAHALGLGVRKVALFLRLGMLEGQRRGRFYEEHPPSRVWIFSRRVTLSVGGLETPVEEGGRMALAWYVWERHHPPSPPRWIP